MAGSKELNSEQSDNQQMHEIRELVLGKDGLQIKQVVQLHARQWVGDVLSEAIHDREKQDGSVNNVLLPLVEKSVEKSIAANSEQYVGYLYPLVGSLVKKSVTAFITELLEKTNTLIENSLTIKGLTWRFRAWQSGVTFSQYAATQTFAYRVEQVFLIHRETGILLNSVSLGLDIEADADLVSSMLTAINDFVSDSFTQSPNSSEQKLDVVRTEDFTLLLKQGPKAAVVAAITGNMPQSVANRLQDTVEEIHKIYAHELNNFDGETLAFSDTEQQLRDCLMSELKSDEQAARKKPWMAWIVVFLILLGFGFLGFNRWQAHELLEQVNLIDQTPGILVTHSETLGLKRIKLEVLRDPAAPTLLSWFEQNSIDPELIETKENAYLSLDPELIKHKTLIITTNYPELEVTWSDNQPSFTGNLTSLNKLLLQNELAKVEGLNFHSSWLNEVVLVGTDNQAANDPELIRAILNLNIAKIDRVTIAFEPGQSELSTQAIEKLIDVKDQFNNLIVLAEQQELSIGLIIMGASDTIGSPAFNKILSQKRANNVKLKLQELGIASNRLNAIGLGVIDLKASKVGARKVLFNVIYFEGD